MTTVHSKPPNTIHKKSGRQASEPPWLQHHTKKISTYRRQTQQQNQKHCHKYTKPETHTHSATHIHSLSLSLSTLLKTNTAPKINVVTKTTTQETCDWVRLSQTAEWSTPSHSLPHPLLLEKARSKRAPSQPITAFCLELTRTMGPEKKTKTTITTTSATTTTTTFSAVGNTRTRTATTKGRQTHDDDDYDWGKKKTVATY